MKWYRFLHTGCPLQPIVCIFVKGSKRKIFVKESKRKTLSKAQNKNTYSTNKNKKASESKAKHPSERTYIYVYE